MDEYTHTREAGGHGIRHALVWTLWMSAVLASAPALAEGPDSEDLAESGTNRSIHAAAETGFERLDDDYYSTFSAKLGLNMPVPQLRCRQDSDDDDCETRFRGQLQAPLRLRVIDNGAPDRSIWRSRDWDEPGDYAKFLRHLQYGETSDPVHAEIGELGSIELGHGTIVNHYHNTVTPDHHRLGLAASWNEKPAGGSLLINDMLRPALVAARGHVRPFEIADPSSWWTRLGVGASLVSDLRAPVTLERDGGNTPVVGPTRRPAVATQQPTAIGGIDVEVEAYRDDEWTVVPYTDLNHHFGLGSGLHSGLSATFSPSERFVFSTRLEYRMLGERYLPDYIGPLYEIDRYQLSGWGSLLPAPKLQIGADTGRGGGLRHGGYAEATARLFDMVSVSGAVADHQGPSNGWARLALQANIFDRVGLGAFFYGHGFDTIDEVFDRDNAFFVVESRVRVWKPLYVKGAYSRMWQLHDDGFYEPINRWQIGAGASFSL